MGFRFGVFRLRLVLEFEFCQAKIIAIRSMGKFVERVTDGQQCALILDRTCFYAEQGGQIYDQGFVTLANESGGPVTNENKLFISDKLGEINVLPAKNQ